MTQENSELFNQEQTTATTEQTPDATPPSELDAYVGEGKKFKTIADLMKSFEHKEAHIKQIEEENKAFRESQAKQKDLEDIVQQLKQERLQQNDQIVQGVDSKQVADLVEQLFHQQTARQVQEANAKQVLTAFRETFGENAKAEYEKLADELGMAPKDLDKLAYSSPKTVLKLISKPAPTHGGKLEGSVSSPPAIQRNGNEGIRVQGNTTKDLASSIRAARNSVLDGYTKEQLLQFGIYKEN
jgi:hypothetical protein